MRFLRIVMALVVPTLGLLLATSAFADPGQFFLYFDGQASYVEVPDSTQFSVPTSGGLTVSAWINPDTLVFPSTEGSGYVHWLGKGEAGRQEWTFRMYSQDNTENRDNRISFYVFNPQGGLGIGSYFQDPINAGEWIHVVGVADAARTYIYKNGVLRKCDQYTGVGDGTCHAYPSDQWITPAHGSAPLRIGTRNFASYFEGSIGQVRLWNRALSASEIADLYATDSVPQKGLVAEYLFNEGAGTIAHDGTGAHDGTIWGAYWPGDLMLPQRLSRPVRSGVRTVAPTSGSATVKR